MVCRENKGRSACIGLVKAINRHMGEDAFHDAEVQSTQHEFKHGLEAMPPMSEKDQIAFWTNLRQTVVDLDWIPDEHKTRKSEGRGGQPGLLTRIDQEINRLKTGKDEKGRTLKPEQLNTPADLGSIIRMGAILERIAPAKTNFLEMNARHRGISMQQATKEWNQLMSRTGNFSNISLLDDYRNSLSGVGITSRDQSDLGQSGRARDAMRIMEDRRLDAVHGKMTDNGRVGGLEARAAIRQEHKMRSYIDPNSEHAKIRCEQCGQFGHLAATCTNGDIVAKRAGLDQQRTILASTIEAGKYRRMLDRSDDEISEKLAKYYPGEYADVAAFRAVHEQRIGALLDGNPEMSDNEIRDAHRQLERQEAQLRRDLDDRGGTPSWIKDVYYNPENGLLAVRPHPYQVKSGEWKTARPIMRRVSPENMQRMLNHEEGFGKAINELGMIRGPKIDNFGFENEDDYAESRVQRKCPTCGQFASLNVQHRCAVPGGPSEQYQAREIAASSAYRELLRRTRNEGGNAPMPPMHRKSANFHVDNKAIRIRGVDGNPIEGNIVTARTGSVVEVADSGHIASPPVRANYPGAAVTGNVNVWEDLDGVRVLSPYGNAGGSGLKCSCDTFRSNRDCIHVRGTTATLANRYQARNAFGSIPGGPAARANTAADAPIGDQNRLSYSTIQSMRAQDNAEFAAMYEARPSSGVHMAAPSAVPARDMDGVPIAEPTKWARNEDESARTGVPVDLDDTRAVIYRVRKLLAGRPPRTSFSVSSDKDGGITVAIPRKHRGTGKEAYYKRELATLLNMQTGEQSKDGFYIQPTSSARFSALDRAAGDPQRIRIAKWTTSPDEIRQERSAEDRRRNRGINNLGVDDAVIGQRTAV